MKKRILFLITGLILFNAAAYTQTIPGKVPVSGKASFSGKISVSGFSKDGRIKEETAAGLFKSFKEDKYRIGFTFWHGGKYQTEQLVLFDMSKKKKRNGRVIGSSSRSGWPWLPGDMFVPAEAFDFIPMLHKEAGSRIKDSKMNALSGRYDIILEMKVSSGQEISGSIPPVTISFIF